MDYRDISATVAGSARQIFRIIAVGGLCGLIVFAFFTVVDGTLRNFLDYQIDIVRDLGGVWVAMSIACCLPLSLFERGHVSVRFLGNAGGAAARRFLDMFASVLVAALMIAMAAEFTTYAWKLQRGNETSLLLSIPIAPFWFFVAAVVWIAALAQVLTAFVVILGIPPGDSEKKPSDTGFPTS